MSWWLVSGLMLVLLCLACPNDEAAYEPVRAPDAGRRFVEHVPPLEVEAETEPRRVEPKPSVGSAESAELREPLSTPQPEPDRTAAAEDADSAVAPPPAGVW